MACHGQHMGRISRFKHGHTVQIKSVGKITLSIMEINSP